MAPYSRKGRAPSEDPLSIVGRTFRKFCIHLINLIYPFAGKGRDLRINYSVEMDRSAAQRMKFGNWIRIRNDVRLQVVAPYDEAGEPVIVMDDETDIGPQCTICARNMIHLEQEVTLGQSVLIMDHSPAHQDIHTPIKDQGVSDGGRIRIGKGSFIAQGSVILCDKGELVIGRNSIIAANSLVTKSFPAYSLIAGNPARMVQQFDPVEGVWVLGGTRSKSNGAARKI